jgi:outer membrane biosynthesis protein TonB
MGTIFALLVLTSSLDREPIKKVLHAANPAFRRCYEAALERDAPGLEGKAALKLSVGENGRVDEVEVDFPTDAPQFTQCLREAALKLRFLKGPAPYRLIWPIIFRAGDAKP